MTVRRGRRAAVLMIGALMIAAGVAAGAAHLGAPATPYATLCLLGAGIVLGEFFVLRLENGAAVPLSYAVLLVLVPSFGFVQYVGVVVTAEALVALAGLAEPGAPRATVASRRLVVALAAAGAWRLVWAVSAGHGTGVVLLGLAAAAGAQVVVDQIVSLLTGSPGTLTARGRLAWLAVTSTGMLMAVSYRGGDGPMPFGLWGPLIFAMPLFVAWYAFDRLDSETRAYRQTVEALAMAPELGGVAPPGHAERVATVAVAIGAELDLPDTDVRDLETAALLHHLGQLTLDDPGDSLGTDEAQIAAVTSAMMRDIEPLAAAGNIVGGDTSDSGRRLAVQALQIANEYDELTVHGLLSAEEALSVLRRAPKRAYDTRVIAALDRVQLDRVGQRRMPASPSTPSRR